jgi:putative salt-induced outer membrane protein YdiY
MHNKNPQHLLKLAMAAAVALTATFANAAEEPRPGWQTSAAAGLTITRGNSRTIVGNVGIQTVRKWEKSELSLGADFNYGKNKGVKNVEDERAYAQFNHNFAERFYFGLRVEGLHDDIADINYRVTVSPLLGVHILKEKLTTLRFEAGPSFIAEEVGFKKREYIALRIAERFEHKFSDRARIWQSAEWLPEVSDWNNWILNFEIGVEASITPKLSLQSKILDTYDREPAVGRQKNDFKWITGLAYKF